jgi:hypothetical protein
MKYFSLALAVGLQQALSVSAGFGYGHGGAAAMAAQLQDWDGDLDLPGLVQTPFGAHGYGPVFGTNYFPRPWGWRGGAAAAAAYARFGYGPWAPNFYDDDDWYGGYYGGYGYGAAAAAAYGYGYGYGYGAHGGYWPRRWWPRPYGFGGAAAAAAYAATHVGGTPLFRQDRQFFVDTPVTFANSYPGAAAYAAGVGHAGAPFGLGYTGAVSAAAAAATTTSGFVGAGADIVTPAGFGVASHAGSVVQAGLPVPVY